MASFAVSVSNSTTLARSLTSSCSAVSSASPDGVDDFGYNGLLVGVPSAAVFLPVPYKSSQ